MDFSLIAKLRRNPLVESMAYFFGFQREYWRNKEQTGSVKASGPGLARAMVEPFWDESCGHGILEVGSGTGAISAQIFQRMQPNDKLTVVEINLNFLTLTRRKMIRSFGHQAVSERVSLVNADFLHSQMPADGFSRICCSLPFNNFAPRVIEELFNEMLRVCKPGGIIVFYEYVLLRRMRYWLSLGRRKDLKEIEGVLTGQIRRYGIENIPVLANFPPAMVYVLRKPRAQMQK